ncbi:MAG: dTDP-4-dehydrorhamnose 3,5-epimerase [Brevundimonas sp.]|jgi:dTDP-4-dehydrorhamnose 3,5-epimerase|uniref:dTDP-4-dehydrorhamnose 3,5-epimerase n=1 Tax=Brevundimonas sp. TaxID=1871086 RepID=UPI004034E887
MANFTVTAAPLPDVKIIQTRKFEDNRGFFVETYSRPALLEAGIDITFVQDNQSFSSEIGTLRGLHFQRPPFAQDKLVRVVRGRIWDVAVDIRRSSRTFGQWFGLELSAENQTQLLVPIGFAHGFLTLEADTEVIYKVSAPYSGAHDAGIMWNDPDVSVSWPMPVGGPVLSDKDRKLPLLSDTMTFD